MKQTLLSSKCPQVPGQEGDSLAQPPWRTSCASNGHGAKAPPAGSRGGCRTARAAGPAVTPRETAVSEQLHEADPCPGKCSEAHGGWGAGDGLGGQSTGAATAAAEPAGHSPRAASSLRHPHTGTREAARPLRASRPPGAEEEAGTGPEGNGLHAHAKGTGRKRSGNGKSQAARRAGGWAAGGDRCPHLVGSAHPPSSSSQQFGTCECIKETIGFAISPGNLTNLV